MSSCSTAMSDFMLLPRTSDGDLFFLYHTNSTDTIPRSATTIFPSHLTYLPKMASSAVSHPDVEQARFILPGPRSPSSAVEAAKLAHVSSAMFFGTKIAPAPITNKSLKKPTGPVKSEYAIWHLSSLRKRLARLPWKESQRFVRERDVVRGFRRMEGVII